MDKDMNDALDESETQGHERFGVEKMQNKTTFTTFMFLKWWELTHINLEICQDMEALAKHF